MAGNQVGVPDKMTVFQKCVSGFNRVNVSAEEARELLTQLVHLFGVGETFTEAEATQLFFTITKLFQKESAGLKQMVYLAIKELVPLTDNVIMGTSVLMRDVQHVPSGPSAQPGGAMDPHLYRPQALRALSRILDAAGIEGMDRLMRSALISRDPDYTSAGLVSAYHLLAISRTVVARWATETAEVVRSQAGLAQYHALGLLREMRAKDAVALRRLGVSDETLVDPYARALKLRIIGESLRSDLQRSGGIPPALGSAQADLQSQQWRVLQQHFSDQAAPVRLEAAKVVLHVCIGTQANVELVSPALCVLRDLLATATAAPARFAAVRAINGYARVEPQLVGQICNDALEACVGDGNKAVASYAVTALLKTGSEASVDALVARISTLVKDMADDFRLVVVDAVRSLAKRYPQKHDQMLDFFAETLEHSGPAELKIAIVEAIGDVLRAADAGSESLNNALLMLCEQIEDSEYPQVTVRVLHLLGEAGPRAPSPNTYVRYIYNRVILENAVVRAAAVSALAKFDGVPGCSALVKQAEQDANDEVRDRAACGSVVQLRQLPSNRLELADLEQKLAEFLQSPTNSKDLDSVLNSVKVVDLEHFKLAPEPVEDEPVEPEVEVPEIEDPKEWGPVLARGRVQRLTDVEMEYVVSCCVLVTKEFVVLQFQVANNYELEVTNVGVSCSIDEFEDSLTLAGSTSTEKLLPGESATLYVAYSRSGPVVGALPTSLVFTVNGELEEYPVDEVLVRSADYVLPASRNLDFEAAWGELDDAEEASATQVLKASNIRDAARLLVENVGGTLLSEIPEGPRATLLLAGLFGDERVLVRAQLVESKTRGIAARVQARCRDADMAWAVVDVLRL